MGDASELSWAIIVVEGFLMARKRIRKSKKPAHGQKKSGREYVGLATVFPAGLGDREKELIAELPFLALPAECPRDFQKLGPVLAGVELKGRMAFLRPALKWFLLAALLASPLLLFFFVADIKYYREASLVDVCLVMLTLWIGAGRDLYCGLKYQPASLWVCKFGVYWRRKDSQGCCLWEELGSFREFTKRPMDDSPWFRAWYRGDLDSERVYYIAELETNNGVKLILRKRTTPNHRACGLLIRHRLRQALLPGCVEALENGNSFSFGPFEMTKTSLKEGEKTIKLAEIQKIQMKKGYIRIRPREGKLFGKFKQFEVSHMGLFLDLVKTFANLDVAFDD